MNSSTSHPKIAFLDTSVASALAKGELSSADSLAFVMIAEAVSRSDLTLWTSTIMKSEMNRIPQPYREAHLDQYNALRTVTAAPTTNWIDDRPGSTSFGESILHPTFKLLAEILPDRTDAELVFQAKAHNVADFITVDRRTILSHAPELRAKIGLNAWSPSDYVSQVLRRSV